MAGKIGKNNFTKEEWERAVELCEEHDRTYKPAWIAWFIREWKEAVKEYDKATKRLNKQKA